MKPIISIFIAMGILLIATIGFAQDARIHLKKGKAAFDILDLRTAISHFGEAIRLDPKNAEAYCYRGQAYLFLGQAKEAITDETKAIQLNPKQVDAYVARGKAYRFLSKETLALADINKALVLDPKNAEAFSARGQIYVHDNNFKEAIADFTRVVELNPQDALAYLELARMLSACDDAKLRDGKKALEYAKKGWELVDQKNDYYMVQAVAASYAELGQFKEAIEWQKKALKNIPDDLMLTKKGAEVRLSLFEKHQAIRYKDFASWIK